MKNQFDKLSHSISKMITKKYSTSFSLGILALAPSMRTPIYSIYAYVRLADEIVDSFHGYDKEKLLSRLKIDTNNALEEGIALNPILHSFQECVHKYKIDKNLIWSFLKSMEMDLQNVEYNTQLYNDYIFGSAEVVGLMCLQVFTEGHNDKYNELKPYAMKLGSAFQKVNFLRDMKDDYQNLGRTYFPNVDMKHFDNDTKLQIENDIDEEFKNALRGIKKLPKTSMFGVYLAYRYYLSLFKKIKKKSSNEILNNRIRVPNSKKAIIAFISYCRFKTNYL